MKVTGKKIFNMKYKLCIKFFFFWKFFYIKCIYFFKKFVLFFFIYIFNYIKYLSNKENKEVKN